jgi:hypothetical protein
MINYKLKHLLWLYCENNFTSNYINFGIISLDLEMSSIDYFLEYFFRLSVMDILTNFSPASIELQREQNN